MKRIEKMNRTYPEQTAFQDKAQDKINELVDAVNRLYGHNPLEKREPECEHEWHDLYSGKVCLKCGIGELGKHDVEKPSKKDELAERLRSVTYAIDNSMLPYHEKDKHINWERLAEEARKYFEEQYRAFCYSSEYSAGLFFAWLDKRLKGE